MMSQQQPHLTYRTTLNKGSLSIPDSDTNSMLEQDEFERFLNKEVEKKLRKVSAFSVFDVNCSEPRNYSNAVSNIMSSELPGSTNMIKSTEN